MSVIGLEKKKFSNYCIYKLCVAYNVKLIKPFLDIIICIVNYQKLVNLVIFPYCKYRINYVDATHTHEGKKEQLSSTLI